MIKLNEVYTAHQGEGATIGKLSLFVRFSGCNLACSWCDSKYAWHPKHQEKSIEVKEESIEPFLLSNLPEHITNIVFTGGEPGLQIEKLKDFMINREGFTFEIETNGTVTFEPWLLCMKNVFINFSPKIFQKKGLKEIQWGQLIYKLTHNEGIIKVVIEAYKYLEQINTLIELLYNRNIPRNKVYLMPEGYTKESQEKAFAGMMQVAKREGFNFSPRLHILAFGQKRRT